MKLATARAAEGVVAAVRVLGEDVWLREAGMLKVSAAPAQDRLIDGAVQAAQELGVPEEAVPLSGAEVAERCRSPVFRRGVFFREGGTVQPARLARALQRAAQEAGATRFEHSRVRRIRSGVIQTARGSVLAREIVVATNAWAAAWNPARRLLTGFGSFVVLTEPVPELLEEIGWTGGEAIFDGRMFLHYFRTTKDGRVLMGSGSGPMSFRGRIDSRFFEDRATVVRAEAGLRRLLPALAGARITHSWGGPIDVLADQLPFFRTVPGTRIHYGAGYSGDGVGPSWLGGRILASLALGSGDELTRLPLVRRRIRSLPPEPVRRLGGGVVRASILACEQAEEEGRRPAFVARAGRALPRALGIRIGTR